MGERGGAGDVRDVRDVQDVRGAAPAAALPAARAAAIPAGTITFLFTDIEGSTRLWEEVPDGMREALARHDALLRAGFEGHGGYVFKTMGDAFCVAFDTAHDALEAALAAQRAMQGEGWESVLGEERTLRVRMALHTGDAQERDGDYFGPSLNRVARLLSAGHGGQVLLSLPTEELVRDALPDGVSVRDMGDRRLKDLIRPERIFQLCALGLRDAFPPLRTLDGRKHNLPVQPTPLIGRAAELEEVRRRLRHPGTRLLTLTGPGGTGKTRLSLQTAADLLDDFEHGVYFVALAAVSEAEAVPAAIARALGVAEEAERPLVETLAEHLREKQLLLVLDNFEQLLATPAAPTVVGELLRVAPGLKALASSRAPLRVYGEREYAVPALRTPDLERLPPLERLPDYEAVRLFIERASDVRPDFTLTKENAPAIVEICQRLDGLPLAIELAAARTKLLSPPQLLGRLSQPLRLLTTGASNLPPRQQTLRNLIAWSYELLGEEERRLFRALGVFSGGWTLAEAEAVCGNEGHEGAVGEQVDVLEGMESLVEKSLVRRVEAVENGDEEPRFTMLETIRAFAVEALDASGEGTAARERHATYYVGLAERGAQELYGSEQVAWLDRFEEEHANLRAALEWLHASGNAPAALRLAAAMSGFWRTRGYLREGRERLEQVFALVGAVAPSAPLAHALSVAGSLAAQLGDAAGARLLLERSLAAWRALGDRRRTAGVLLNLGALAYRLGDYAAAREVLDDALAVQRDLGLKAGMVLALNNLALVQREQSDLPGARASLEESLALLRALSDVRNEPLVLVNLGDVALEEGDGGAAAYYRSGLEAALVVGDARLQAHALEGLACAGAAAGVMASALRLAGAAHAIREKIGATLALGEAARLERWLGAARAALADGDGDAAWRAGREAALEDVIRDALAGDG